MSLVKYLQLPFLSFVIIMPIACSSSVISADQQETAQKSVNISKQEWRIGRVVYNELEGGFYGIITDGGEKLLPLNLDERFKQHNNKIAVKGQLKKGVITFQQWGTPFHIVDIKLLEQGTGSTKHHSR